MRVVVVGASGNAGTSLLEALAEAPGVESVVGIARRRPEAVFAKTTWVEADVERDDLTPHFRGADAVVHLAWRIQPSHDLASLWRTNVEGSTRVFRAVAEAGVPALVYASSVGVYSRAPKDRTVDESWPRDGIRTSFYSRHKAEVERRLDRFERELPGVRVVRVRPALLFKRDAASGIRRLFLGPFLPSPLLRRELIPAIPDVPGLRFQAVHSRDIGEAYRLTVTSDVRGPFNVAAEPVLDSRELARILGARSVRVPARALRAAGAASWRLHLQPTPPGWIDLALGVPVMDVTRARQELGWTPTVSASDAFAELVDGIRERAGVETPPLAPGTGGPARAREILSGVGEREG
jgi:nucleoside-diphosphate-sugar epimerase